MFASSMLIRLLTATSALASAPSPDGVGSGRQAVLGAEGAPYSQGPVEWAPFMRLIPNPIECPPDFPCGSSNNSFLCTPRYPERCPGRTGPVYADVRVLVGCESLPAFAPLCPLNRCKPDCLCRETLLRRLQILLLERPNGASEDVYSAENKEL